MQIFSTRRYGAVRAPTSSSCGGLVALGHLEGPSGPMDSCIGRDHICMDSCIGRDHSCMDSCIGRDHICMESCIAETTSVRTELMVLLILAEM